MEKMQKIISKCIGLCICAVLFVFANPVAAATSLYFSPSANNVSIGETFSVSMFVQSTDQAMNAVSANIVYDSSKVELLNTSKAGTIIFLWIVEPSFSNTSGSGSLEGLLLTPGYTGNAGKILSYTFRAKAQGTASIGFNGGRVLANDGGGSDINQGFGTATVTIGPAAVSDTVKDDDTAEAIISDDIVLPINDTITVQEVTEDIDKDDPLTYLILEGDGIGTISSFDARIGEQGPTMQFDGSSTRFGLFIPGETEQTIFITVYFEDGSSKELTYIVSPKPLARETITKTVTVTEYQTITQAWWYKLLWWMVIVLLFLVIILLLLRNNQLQKKSTRTKRKSKK